MTLPINGAISWISNLINQGSLTSHGGDISVENSRLIISSHATFAKRNRKDIYIYIIHIW